MLLQGSLPQPWANLPPVSLTPVMHSDDGPLPGGGTGMPPGPMPTTPNGTMPKGPGSPPSSPGMMMSPSPGASMSPTPGSPQYSSPSDSHPNQGDNHGGGGGGPPPLMWSLTRVSCDNCSLTGTLPVWNAPQLLQLSLANNSFVGDVSAVSGAGRLQQLSLGGNQMSFGLTDKMQQWWPQLKSLSLQRNMIYGQLPPGKSPGCCVGWCAAIRI